MGITGLLPFLKGIQRNVHVSALKGTKVGIDAYCWLHKGSYSCAMEIVMKTADIEKLPLINYCLKRVNLLRRHDVTPIMVFDGGYLPTKSSTEKERRQKRQLYLSKGKELLKQGKRSEARDCFQKSVDISPEMALAFIKECRKLGVQCIVAPYEADAQLAYLSKEGLIDTVITEDSDLLVFGSKKVLYKMDESGNGKMIELRDLGKANKNLTGFTEDSFRQMCILSGCDYLPSVPGIGLGKATKLMRKHRMNPVQVIRALRCENSKVPSDYDANFKKAEYTFLYQLVFDPRTQKQVRLTELPEGVEPSEFEYAGVEHSPRKAILMARGNINPITQEVMDVYSPSKAPPPPPPPKASSWSCSAMGSANKQYPVAIQAKLPMSSSAKSSRPFKPPSRLRVKSTERADGALQDEELMNLYTTCTEQDAQKPEVVEPSIATSKPSLSKFFATESLDDSSTDLTPTDADSEQLKPFSRRLYDNQTENSSDEIKPPSPPSVTPGSPSVTSGSPSVTSGSCLRKRLFPSAITEKLCKYAFGSSKRQRIEGQDQRADTQIPVAKPIRSNPFAIASPSLQSLSRPDNDTSTSDFEGGSEWGSHSDVDYDRPTNCASENRCDLSSTTCTSSHGGTSRKVFCRSGENTPVKNAGLVDPIGESVQDTDPTSVLKDIANPHYQTEQESMNTQPASSSSPAKRKNWFPNHQKALTNPSKVKQGRQSCKKVGLSKNMKPGRFSAPGPGQFQLYSFTRKPQMKL